MDDALHRVQVLSHTAPRDNLSYDERRVTAEEIRSEEQAYLRRGVAPWVLYDRDDENAAWWEAGPSAEYR